MYAPDKTFIGYSLVDITPTGVVHTEVEHDLPRNQQRNWETVLQCIGIRTQPLETSWRVDEVELSAYEFGEFYSGTHRVWSLAFTVDHAGVFGNAVDPVHLLHLDFDQVPVITYLTETARFMLPVFYTHGAIKNIYFKTAEFGVNT